MEYAGLVSRILGNLYLGEARVARYQVFPLRLDEAAIQSICQRIRESGHTPSVELEWRQDGFQLYFKSVGTEPVVLACVEAQGRREAYLIWVERVEDDG